MAQPPFGSVFVRIELEGLEPETLYYLTVRTYGYKTHTCLNSGAEFNPLLEVNYRGHLNPHADPARGRIEKVTSDKDGKVAHDHKEYLGNLAGLESIIGRSIHLSKKD